MPGSLEPEVRERLRLAVERIAERFPDPKRAQGQLSEILGVHRSQVGRLLNPKGKGGSLSIIKRASGYLNEPIEGILFGETVSEPVRKLRELPEFAEAMTEAVRRAEREHPGITREDLEAAADIRATPQPARVTAGLLIQLALARRGESPLPPKSRSRPT